MENIFDEHLHVYIYIYLYFFFLWWGGGFTLSVAFVKNRQRHETFSLLK